jgi:hypothetical protein
MNFSIIKVVGIVIIVIVKAIPFVEDLFTAGADKKTAVMNLAETAANSVSDQIIANNPNWSFIKPMADKFIEDVIAAINAVEAANKPT